MLERDDFIKTINTELIKNTIWIDDAIWYLIFDSLELKIIVIVSIIKGEIITYMQDYIRKQKFDYRLLESIYEKIS